MLLSNMNIVPGREIEIIGIVDGSAAHAKHIGKDLMAGLKNVVGGELKGYSEMIEEAKQNALNKMTAKAQSMGADAVINIRYAVTNMSQGSAIVVVASGTAVKIK